MLSPNARARKERIFTTAVRPKIGKKSALSKNFNTTPPNLDGNLSFTLNPLTASKLDHFLLTLPEGLSETANEDKDFDQHFWNENENTSIVSLMR